MISRTREEKLMRKRYTVYRCRCIFIDYETFKIIDLPEVYHKNIKFKISNRIAEIWYTNCNEAFCKKEECQKYIKAHYFDTRSKRDMEALSVITKNYK